jgi:ubiquinone/menaquinone biosynthesis C-methylase UbiE
MDKKTAIKQFKKHLEECVGKSPSNAEMGKIGKRVKGLDSLLKKSDSARVKEVYDNELANLWGKIVACETGTREIEMFLKYSNCREDSSIISVGSGIGVFESFLAKKVLTRGKICCVDFSKSMSEQAENIRLKLNLDNMKVISASAERVPADLHSADILLYRRTGLSSGNLWLPVLKEAYKLIKLNGYSRLIYTVGANLAGSPDEIKKTLKMGGFEFVKLDFFLEKDRTKIAMIVARPRV